MARARHSVRHARARRPWALVALVMLLAWVAPAAAAQAAEGIEDGDAEMRRWSRIFFGVASTLDGGKSSVGLLRSRISLRDPTLEASMEMVTGRYGEYVASVERFRTSVSGLLDRPQALPLFFRALMDGHQACWRLSSFARLVETYGVTGRDMLSILSSIEACDRFRQVAFSPGVEERIHDALAVGEARRRELAELREEHRELERLLDDLLRIDEGE